MSLTEFNDHWNCYSADLVFDACAGVDLAESSLTQLFMYLELFIKHCVFEVVYFFKVSKLGLEFFHRLIDVCLVLELLLHI